MVCGTSAPTSTQCVVFCFSVKYNSQQVGGARGSERHARGDGDAVSFYSKAFANRGVRSTFHHFRCVVDVFDDHRVNPPNRSQAPRSCDVGG